MATLEVIGSSSAGNCYLLNTESETLMIEAGVNWATARPYYLRRSDKVAGCLVTHEHKDHSRHGAQVAALGVDVYASEGTQTVMRWTFARTAKEGEVLNIGEFRVLPFRTFHDAADPLGFYISHPEIGNMVFATDTKFLANRFSNVNYWCIECNYMAELLDANTAIHEAQKERIRNSHMELGETVRMLQANDLSQSRMILLLHLSDRNSNEKAMQKQVQAATGIRCEVAPANKYKSFTFNRTLRK